MSDILSRLAEPFPPDRVSWRLGALSSDKKKGIALAYIDARDVQDRLNQVCGPHWQCEHIPSGERKVTCRIGIKIGDEWIWRSNGAGDTDIEGEKGSYSDSFKRAAVLFGIGRYLYDVASPWVELEAAGRSFKIKESELPKLRKVLEGKQTPEPKSEPKKPGLILKVAGKPDQTFEDEKAWFVALATAVKANPFDWSANRPTAVKLAKESEEWIALAKKIGGMAAPAAA